MRANSLVGEYNGTMTFTDGSTGIFHAQGEWSDATGELVWSIDPVESQATTHSTKTLSGYTTQLMYTVTLDTNQTFVYGQWFDGRFWTLVGDDDPDDLLDNIENADALSDLIDHMRAVIGL